MSGSSNYKFLERVGEGTFGEVHKAVKVDTGTLVAVKRVRLRNIDDGNLPNTALREMRALQHLDHPNVIKLLEVHAQGLALMLVFELMSFDLSDVLQHSARPLSDAHTRRFMEMLLRGLSYCHANSIIHRDLKPSNLLISNRGTLKIADFGLARVHRNLGDELQAAGQRRVESPGDVDRVPTKEGDEEGRDAATDTAGGADRRRRSPYTHQVATRWYRAPELLFGARYYGAGVDIWAVGAIFGELLNHSPVFPGENDIDQIYRVLQILGTPDERQWPELPTLPDFGKIHLPQMPPLPWSAVVPNASMSARALLGEFLRYV